MCKETCTYFRGSDVQISLKPVFSFFFLAYRPLIWMILVGDET